MEENDAGARALIDAFRAELEHPEALTAAQEPELARLLSAFVDQGRSAWPALELPAEKFARRIARHWRDDHPLEPWLARLRVADLYLACACEHQVPGAIEAFDRTLLVAVPTILKRSGPQGLQADEIRQRVRERLFVGAAKIADYSGRGALANWLEVVTLRIAIDAKRKDRGIDPDTSVESAAAHLAHADPELDFIKERYRDVFKRAFRAALRALAIEQRNLLKLHFVDEVTLDQLATLFHVHRATVARRIAAAREAVLDGVRDHLRSEHAIDESDYESLLRLVRSRIELSLSVLLSEPLD